MDKFRIDFGFIFNSLCINLARTHLFMDSKNTLKPMDANHMISALL